ncbi:MAG: polyprenyl synthetase family protein [Candidatus Aenigmarchaeota archaeon]|nr:polyprenyl synthetase family protein [Candidatus Aenigmarchaeota archaeon]
MIDFEKTGEKAHLIDKELERVLPKKGIENLHDAINYHMDTGGKRLRPLLAILACEALGGDVKKILPFAASCELLHNWFLVHDDIEDGDKVRRDKPAVWVKYGLAHGVNVGDYMAQKVFELILHSKDYGVSDDKVMKLLDAMVKTSLRTAEGQTMDINLRSNDKPTEKQYFDMVIGKTAHYLTVTLVGAAIMADREDLIPKLIDFGKNLGPAFQITDDILDLTEGKGRKEIGRDIKEGKRSILVVHCLNKCGGDEKKKLLTIINKEPEKTTDEDVTYAKILFEKYGSVEYAKQKAEKYASDAKKIAGKMPAQLKEILDFFADYIVNRRK